MSFCTVEDIKKPIYTNVEDFENDKKSISRSMNAFKCVHGHCKKTRGINVKGVLKNDHAIHITIGLDYLKHIKEKIKAEEMKRSNGYAPHVTIYFDKIIEDLFPDENAENLYVPTELFWSPVTDWNDDKALYANGNDEYSKAFEYDQPTFSFNVYKVNEFVLLPLTQKEKDLIEAEDKRKRAEHFNKAFLQDTIITAVKKETGIDLKLVEDTWQTNGRAYLRVPNKQEWQDLVSKALIYYLNDIVKEQKIRLKEPKRKKGSTLDCWKPLFFIDEIEMINEGE